MRTLYHQPLSPGCRTVRLVMGEKGLETELMEERDWERREEFLIMNPAGEVPVLEEEDGTVIASHEAIVGFLEDLHGDPPVLPGSALDRAEIRRLVSWFDRKFAQEVSQPLLYEKVTRRFLSGADGGGAPDMPVVRASLHNLRYHLDYVSYVMESRNWLAGTQLTLADLTAAAHLSCLDYVGDVPWNQYPEAKDWYARVKSRPSFRTLLADHVAGMPPPRAYADLDF